MTLPGKMRAWVFRQGRWLGAETFLAKGTAWEKVWRREDAGVLAKGKSLIQVKRRGYFFHPDAGLTPRSLGSSAIVKDRFHGSQPDFLFPSVQFFPCLEISVSISDALLRVLLCVILHKTPHISSTPSHSRTWYFSQITHDRPTSAHVCSLSVSLWFLIILF